MQLIPVVDLMQGQVVRAVRGDRQSYQPVRSQLCDGADPVRVARALTAHCASPWLYVADLDALRGRAPQQAAVVALLTDDPTRQCWVDAGFADVAAARAWWQGLGPMADRVTPVFGSESLRDARALTELRAPAPWAPPLLSLDRRAGQALDAAGCWTTPQAWPQRVIVMTLERVGAGLGPDLRTLAAVRAQAPGAWLVGAGGIRNAADLAAAEAAGAQAWLAASALHDGAIAPRSASALPKVGR